MKKDAVRTEWNRARTAYYADPTAANELRMEKALQALMAEQKKEADRREPAEMLHR